MITSEEIVALYRRRKADLEPVNRKRAQVRDAYNGEMRVLLPEIGGDQKAAVANLLNTGLDQLAMRVSSTLPQVLCPPRDESRKREVSAAEVRRRALYGWWQANNLSMMLPRRARQMLAYAQSPVQLWPDFERGVPVWRMRDPMGTFPAPTVNPGEVCPPDCVFAYTQTYGWLRRHHREHFDLLARPRDASPDDRVTLLDYVDADELVTVVLSAAPTEDVSAGWNPAAQPGLGGVTPLGAGWLAGKRFVELSRLRNRAGVCTAVVPGRITLDKAMGQFDGILHMAATQARLMALELIAVEKGIFPDTYLESRPGETGKFVTGPHDGRTGLVNIVTGGVVREVGTNPGFQTNPAIDRLERAQRLTAGIPADFGGESPANIRTGRRGDAVLSAAVDFPVQEQQKVLAHSLMEENRRAIAISKGYFGSRQQSFYVSWKGAKGLVDFVPNEVFTTDHNVVEFSHAGSDLNGLTIMVGQLVGMGTMSKQTAAELLPIIEDPEREHDRGIRESLEAAMLASIQQKVNGGEIAPVDAAWLMQQVVTNKLELPEAVIKLDERVQRRQREAAEQQADPTQPDPMAGLAAGTAAEQQFVPPPSIPEGPEGQRNLSSMLSSLRLGQMRTPQERPPVVA